MNDKSKPHEWFIHPQYKHISGLHETRTWPGIHVIEYSAYVKCREELLQCKGELACALTDLSYARAARHQVEDRFAAIVKERDLLQEAADDLTKRLTACNKAMKDAVAVGHLRARETIGLREVHLQAEVSQLLQDRKNLIEEVERLRSTNGK